MSAMGSESNQPASASGRLRLEADLAIGDRPMPYGQLGTSRVPIWNSSFFIPSI